MRDEDFDGLDREELLELRDRLTAQVKELTTLIKAFVIAGGDPKNQALANWRRDKQQRGVSLSRVEHALKRIKEKEKEDRSQSVEARFLELALVALPEEVYKPLLDQAKQEVGEGVWAIK